MSLKVYPAKPDFDSMARCLKKESAPERVHFAELYLDGVIKKALCRKFDLEVDVPHDHPLYDIKLDIMLSEFLGYDLVRVHLPGSEFPMDVVSSASGNSPPGEKNERGYIVHEQAGPIQNWKDFENYPWPDIQKLDAAPLEWLEKNIPEGMKAYDLSSQFFECASWLLGYESLFMKMYDDPELIEAVLDKIAEIYFEYNRLLSDFDCIGAIWGTDDMGFKTQTLVSPEWLKNNILPLHKKAAEIAHRKSKLYFLHSCGNIEPLMEDLIEDVGIDAKHSFEDDVIPVEKFCSKYGDRIGVIGGVDINFLASASEDEVRRKVRHILETCHSGGGYCLGSGNSITDYIPLKNYLAMLDEGRRFGRD